MIRRNVFVSFAALTLLATAAIVAGPLNPPAGPVASTSKSLAEVEPRIAINAINTPGDVDSLFKITQPGSYYLTGNITGESAKHGIEIASGGVNLDLNGFDLVGVAGPGSFNGVHLTAAGAGGVAVVNGSVRNWTGTGVDLGSAGAIACRVEKVLSYVNGGAGITTGEVTTITNCSASLNTLGGIVTSNGSTVFNCSASVNGGDGISTGTGCTVSNSSAYDNTGTGINASHGNTVSNCSAYSNASTGIATGSTNSISNCSVKSNASDGISAGGGTTILNCSAMQNTGIGIATSSGCTVSNCSASFNTGSGISVDAASTVADCTAQSNTIDGIACSFNCVIRGNTCAFNGNGLGNGAGIHTTGGDNRLEGNTCTQADRGIDVDFADNIIIRNTCSGNTTNWDIVSGNFCLVVQGAISGAILGNTGGVSLGSTDPNANFSY